MTILIYGIVRLLLLHWRFGCAVAHPVMDPVWRKVGPLTSLWFTLAGELTMKIAGVHEAMIP
jgi:hypothetical protein